MKDHVKLLGILWIVFGLFCLAAAGLVFLIGFGTAHFIDVEDVGPGLLRLIAVVAGSFLGLVALPQIAGGLGLLRYKEWARILTLVVSFLSLPHVPFGTALGIYSMIVLFNPETARLFQEKAPAPAPPTS
ncbi:MAG: hypothetical protein KA243_03010 [Candidatus Aminicenantes bacterium]|nr:hypothetical protein [Candidatus Aminicenantes bacterium]NLH75433.1 hypothetical protein [Acidobacteriota bacterium]